jgi:hypothetical protein
MFTRFQLDLLAYTRIAANAFIKELSRSGEGFIIIEDITPDLLVYLDKSLKQDLDVHEPASEGYKRLQDMLIEVHTKHSIEFTAAMVREALLPLKQTQL